MTGVGLSGAGRVANGSESDTEDKRPMIAEGDTDWTTYQVGLDVPTNVRPALVRLLLQMSGPTSEQRGTTNYAWIKDV